MKLGGTITKKEDPVGGDYSKEQDLFQYTPWPMVKAPEFNYSTI